MTAVSQLMSSPPVMVDAQEKLSQAARLMRERDVGVLGVLRDGRLAGALSDRDIVIRAVAEGRDPGQVAVAEVTAGEVVTISPDAELDEAERLMAERRVRRLFVGTPERPVGLISIDDIARSRDRESVQSRQLEVHEDRLLRGYQGHTGQGE